MTNKPIIYKKFCKRCGKYFRPNGRHQKICEECLSESHKIRIKNYNNTIKINKLKKNEI